LSKFTLDWVLSFGYRFCRAQ